MLLIALIALAAVWAAVSAVVVGLCVSAARGDRDLLDPAWSPAPVPAPRRSDRTTLRFVTRPG